MKTWFLMLLLTASAAFGQATATLSQQEAVKAYPDLADPGTPFNQRFLAKVRAAKDRNDPILSRDDWPMTIAKEVGRELKTKPVVQMNSEPGRGLQRVVKLTVEQLTANPFSLEGAMIELTGIRDIKPQEVEKGVYEIEIWGRGSNYLKATLDGEKVGAVTRSPTLFVSISKPGKYSSEIIVHGNNATYQGLSVVPTVGWR